MRAIEMQQFGLDGLVAVQKDQPEPGPGEVLVRMQAASINYHDLATVLGLANPRLQLPVVPLSDGAGVVEAVGEGVTTLNTGDLVTSYFFPAWQSGEPRLEKLSQVTGETRPGVMQDYWVGSADVLIPAPAHLSALEAATLPCAALTAWRAVVVEGKVKAGDIVLLQGTGGVSLFALQFSRMLGAETIITSSSDEKLQRAANLGADHLINYRDESRWGKVAQQLTGGRGVDLVVEVGGAGTLPESLNAARIGGHISMIGVLSGVMDQIPTAKIMAKNLTVRGITVGNSEHFAAMNRAIAYHRLKPVIGEVLGFDQLHDALQLMQSGAHFGKICLDFQS